MDSRVAAILNTRVYEDFQVSTELVQEKDCDTFLLNLPGFKKEQLKVQVTRAKILGINGSRQIGDNKWSRFQKEFPLSTNYDTQKISAKFEGGILYIRLPKLITTEEKQDSKVPASDAATPAPEPAHQKQPQKGSVQEQASEKPAQKDDSSKQTDAQYVTEEPKVVKEKNAEPTDSEKNPKKSPEEKTSGLDDSKNRSTADDLDDSKKKSIADDLEDGKKKCIACEKLEDDGLKAAEKMEKETSTETADGRGKSKVQNCKETAVDLPSKLKKHRRIFNLTLVVIIALAIGLYITNFIKSLKRDEN